MEMKYIEYGIVFLAVVALSWAFLLQPTGPQRDASGTVVQSSQNYQYFQQQAAASGSDCGDLKNEANVQHLSHHPDKYASCLRQVEPALLQKATGKTLQQIIGG